MAREGGAMCSPLAMAWETEVVVPRDALSDRRAISAIAASCGLS